MAQGQDWNAIGVLNFNGEAIAVVNPYTMLAPARDYTGVKKIRQLPWYEDGFLIGYEHALSTFENWAMAAEYSSLNRITKRSNTKPHIRGLFFVG